MAFVHGELVLETTTTTGTGTLTLAGATSGHKTFSAGIGEGNTCAYSIEASNGQKETGIGTVVSGTLERTTLKASSTGSKLDLPAGTHYVGGGVNSESFTSAAIAYTASSVGAVQISVAAKLDRIVSVYDFDAVGNGIADDTAAIQAALDSLAGIVYLGDGDFRTTAPLIMTKTGQTLQGAGRRSTTIFADFRGGAVISIHEDRCAVRDLYVQSQAGSARRLASSFEKTAPDNTVDGKSVDYGIELRQSGTLGANIYTTIERVDITSQPGHGFAAFGGTSGTIIRQVGVSYCGGHGIYFSSDDDEENELARPGITAIEYCIVRWNWGDGINLCTDGGNTCYRFIVTNCDIANNAKGDGGTYQPAFDVAGGAEIEARTQQLTIDSCAVGQNEYGINLGRCEGAIIRNTRFVSISERGLYITEDQKNIQIINPFCVGILTTTGIRVLDGCQNVSVTGAISSQWGKLINANVECQVNADNRQARTVPGASDELFYLTGVEEATIASGAVEIRGSLVSLIGEGGVADTVTSFAFDGVVYVPENCPFTVVNDQAYDITITSSGNIVTHGADVVLSPNQSATFIRDGALYLRMGTTDHGALTGLADVDHLQYKIFHGVEAPWTLTWDNATHIVTVASGTNTYWFQGTKYTTTSEITCDLDTYVTLTAYTLYYVAFDDASGTLKASASLWDLRTKVPVATLFWNGSLGALSYECHSHTRDLDWHTWAHLSVGARYGSGLSQTAPTTASDNVIQIESGNIYDEDINYTIPQQLNMRGWYQVSSGVYTFGSYSRPYPGAAGAPQFLDTDTYTLNTFAANAYICYWVYATNDVYRPIYVIPSHRATAYGTIAQARAETAPSLSGLNLAPEMKLIYRWIYGGDGQYQEGADYRLSSPLPNGGTASTTAAAVSFAPSGTIAATTVQTAIEELDSEKLAMTVLSGLTAIAVVDTLPDPQVTGTLYFVKP